MRNITYGQPEMELVIEPLPDNHTLYIEAEPKELWIVIRLREKNVHIEWGLDGPGEFRQLGEGAGGIYRSPDQIEGTSATATIAVLITNDQGETAHDSVMFNLIAPAPTPTPSPTPTPMPLSIRQTLVKHENVNVKPGDTVIIIADITTPPNSAVSIECTAIKGNATCKDSMEESETYQSEIVYTAPSDPGKDMVEIKLIDSDSGKIDYQIVKIEIFE